MTNYAGITATRIIISEKIGTGETYSEAVDLIASEFEYAETDILIEEEEVI